MLLTTLVCVSCSVTPALPQPSLRGVGGKFDPIEGANLLARGDRLVDPGVTHEELLELTQANESFALDLYRKLATESSQITQPTHLRTQNEA